MFSYEQSALPPNTPFCRKFSRTYLPVLLYNNPSVECSIERAAAWDESPGVVITRSNGSEQLYNLRAMADATPGRVDKELFRLLGASSAFARDVSYGSGTTSVKARRDRRVRLRAESAEAESEGTRAENSGSAVAGAAPAEAASALRAASSAGSDSPASTAASAKSESKAGGVLDPLTSRGSGPREAKPVREKEGGKRGPELQ